MNYKRLLSLTVALLLCVSVFSQNEVIFYQSNLLTVLNSSGDTISEPFTGGLKFPVFSTMDLNNDGKNDLIVLDRSDSRVLTFINEGMAGIPKFQYRPQFELFFPILEKYILLKDYNGDHLPDLFSFSTEFNTGFDVYLNTSSAYNISFKKVVNQISALYFGTYKASVYYNGIDIPVFEDMDADGDLDILTFSATGQYMDYFENQSVEKYGNADSFDFEFADQCWGKFKEDDMTNKIKLGNSCGDVRGPQRHSGSASTLIDLDDDKDFDLLLSDVQYPEVNALINGRKEKAWFRDSIIEIKTHFPDSLSPILIRSMPATYYMDIDNDEVNDLISAPLDMEIVDTFQNINQIWLYLNKGKNTKPEFSFNSSSFLQENMLDFGGRSSPVFFDYDLDGDPDLFVSTIGDFFSTYHKSDKIVLFENVGISNHPVFKMIDTDYLSITSMKLSGISPAFGDLDKDGDADMLLGLSNGKLAYFKNIAVSGQKANFVMETLALGNIDVGDFSKPAIFDVNGDGYGDLIIGEKDGNLSYFINKGNSGTPDFTFVSDSFGGIKFPVSQKKYSSPCIFDLNGNGKMDLIIGIKTGEILFYPDFVQNIAGVFVKSPLMIRDTTCRCNITKPIGNRLSPAVAFLDGDNKADLIIGSERGGLLLFTSKADTVNISIPDNYKENHVSATVYPNPAIDYLEIRIDQTENHRIIVCNMLDITGKVLISRSFKSNEKMILNVSSLKQGIYLFNIRDNTTEINQTIKVVINK